jgi:hypothetical protein
VADACVPSARKADAGRQFKVDSELQGKASWGIHQGFVRAYVRMCVCVGCVYGVCVWGVCVCVCVCEREREREICRQKNRQRSQKQREYRACYLEPTTRTTIQAPCLFEKKPFCSCFVLVLELEPRASSIPCKYSTTGYMPTLGRMWKHV